MRTKLRGNKGPIISYVIKIIMILIHPMHWLLKPWDQSTPKWQAFLADLGRPLSQIFMTLEKPAMGSSIKDVRKKWPFFLPLPLSAFDQSPTPHCGRPHLASYTALWSDSVISRFDMCAQVHWVRPKPILRVMQLKLHEPTMAIGYSLRMCARHVDSTNPGRHNVVI